MLRPRPFTIASFVLFAVACADPGPVAPRLPRSASFASSCSLGMSDAQASATLDAIVTAINALEAGGSLTSGQANALRKHIENIRKSIAAGNYCAAVSQLNAFKDQVATFVSGGVLTPQQAGPLTGGANDVIEGAYYVTFMSAASFPGQDAEIYSARSDGTNLVNHTNNPAWDAHGRWSPDGSKMAFLSNREGVFKVFVVNSDGSGLTRLTNSDTHDSEESWSPDGNRIAFMRVRDPAPRELWVMNADGSNQMRVAYGEFPSWSPDGTRLVYHSVRSDNTDLYTINVDGTNETRLTTDPAFDGYALWSPDGSQIAWTSERDGNRDVYVIKPDGSGLKRLTATASASSYSGALSWSPDGTVLVHARCTLTSFTSNCQIYSMNGDGSGAKNLTNDPTANEGEAYFSPDGKRLVFTRSANGSGNKRDVYVMNADGTGKQRVTTTSTTMDNFSIAWRALKR